MTRIVILGGGPAGYEAALVAASLGAEVTVIDSDGIGGSCVLTDCVPSKALIATSARVTSIRDARQLGVGVPPTLGPDGEPEAGKADGVVDLAAINARIKALAARQSADISIRLEREGITVLAAKGRFAADHVGRSFQVEAVTPTGTEVVEADVVLVATGATPRVLPTAVPDGERILSWRQVYDLTEIPEHLIVVGSGVTGAEFASGYSELGVKVTLVSSRDRVLPSQDADAATVIEDVFTERGGTLLKLSRAAAVERTDTGVRVVSEDGREVFGSHALMCLGSVPNTTGIGIENIGLALDRSGYVVTDRVSRTSVPGVYAAGDCTGVMLLASVAGMQGRIAMWHALGEAVAPLRLKTVAATVFTHPEIATVGLSSAAVAEGGVDAREVIMALGTNARAKMSNITDGFIKVICREATGVVIGGVVVAPEASELIMPLTIAVQRGLTVDELAATLTVYPSLSGSIAEAARRLMQHDDLA